MATTSSFDAMLKRYMPYELLVEELKRQNYFWNKVKKSQDWGGGTLEIPYESAEASSLSFGALTSASDIAEAAYVMGTISTQPELWGTMIFNEKDLDRHGDMEKSYLKIVPGKINQFISRMSDRVSLSLLGDGSVCKVTDSTNAATGIMLVDHPERLAIGEKLTLDDDDSGSTSVYVTAINVNTRAVTLSATRGGGAANLAAYTAAQNAKLYLIGGDASGFTSLRQQLLSAANGGSTNLFGNAKTTAPFLQSINVSGASFSASTLLDDIFGAFFDVHKYGKGNPTEILCGFGAFKNIAKQLEVSRQYSTTDKAAGYGWRSVNILGVDGEVKITALRDMADSEMPIIDWDSMEFHGSNFFERKRHMDGSESFLVRNTTGYQYIVDCKLYGDLVVHQPSHCGIIHSIPAAAVA